MTASKRGGVESLVELAERAIERALASVRLGPGDSVTLAVRADGLNQPNYVESMVGALSAIAEHTGWTTAYTPGARVFTLTHSVPVSATPETGVGTTGGETALDVLRDIRDMQQLLWEARDKPDLAARVAILAFVTDLLYKILELVRQH